MARICIHLLGPMQVTLDGQVITRFETEKARALLAYLAVEAGQPHRRSLLAEMLWPERPEGAANANLRHTLASLRRAIGDDRSMPPCLLVTRQTIQLNNASGAWVDVTAFITLLRTPQPTGEATIQALEEASGLYRGPFLADVSLDDSAAFAEWMLVTREQLGRQASGALNRLTQCYEQLGQRERALQHAWRQVEWEPWDEQARRQLMRLLALTGQRSAALAQYEACRRVLTEELGVEPDQETRQLYECIRDGTLEIPSPPREFQPSPQLPRFMLEEAEETEPPIFVAREPELARLRTFLDEALRGTGRMVFVSGGAGQGKTALLGEFMRRAMDAHADLLVARGDCSAYSGAGDPYLPFRDVMAMLTGDVESRWLAGSIGRNHARRLWGALPLVVPALLAGGSSLIGTILAGDALLSRVVAARPDRADWLRQLRALTERARAGPADLEQSFLFEQFTIVLRALADQHPLALLLDDLQWADSASVGLLFHLGRRLATAGVRILVVCAYRPEEVALGRAGERHPLEKVLHECKRTLGDVWVDLDRADSSGGRTFVDALLDSEPNRLGEEFRAALCHKTQGHPLFTVELLRAMQERGDLVRDTDGDGTWIDGPGLHWEELPSRVEAVIEERVGRLAPGLQEIVRIASVEGQVFTAEVLAAVQNSAVGPLLRNLQELEILHRLVREQGEVQVASGRLLRYRFGHILFQDYVYGRLSRGERRHLHGQVAAALESLYEGQEDEIAVQLAYHLLKADDWGRAFQYSVRGAERAAHAYAYEEAVALYTQAIDLAHTVPLDVVALAGLLRGRGLAHKMLGAFEQARVDHEMALQAGREAGERQVEWCALLDLADVWTFRDYDQSRTLIDQALELAHRMDNAAILARSLDWAGNWWLNAEHPQTAMAYHQQALAIFEHLGDRADLASTLDRLGIASLIGGDLGSSVGYYDRAIALFRELEDPAGLAASLTGRSLAGSGECCNPTVVSPITPVDSRRDLDEALHIARETDSPAAEAWALLAQSLLDTGHGRLGPALEAAHNALEVSSAIGHREWMAGSRSVLGALYVELFAPEEAQRHLRQALTMAQRLRSQHWIHHATGALAAACCLVDDLAQAQSWLEAVISPQTAMDTVHRRMCWARHAELALRQGDPALALDIAERLIASAPGMSPARVVAFLWKLKGEALAAMGHAQQACSVLQAAAENARALAERSLLWRIHASLGRLYGAMQRWPEGQQELSVARALVDELADTVPDPALRAGFRQRASSMLEPLP